MIDNDQILIEIDQILIELDPILTEIDQILTYEEAAQRVNCDYIYLAARLWQEWLCIMWLTSPLPFSVSAPASWARGSRSSTRLLPFWCSSVSLR